jgi:hypothetical protein
MFGDQNLELGGEPRMPTETQPRVDPQLLREESQLLESRDRGARERFVGEVREGRAVPERQRSLQLRPRLVGGVELERAICVGDELLETVQVELVLAELQRVAGRLRHDRLAALPERLPELRDADLQRGQPRLRLLVPPQLFEQADARDRLVCVQEEDRQQRALL